ncbi:helix-turn-helix domain-containing protein [Eubacterium sp.]|uniref:helix-turn-helix domain-containing protein n=1 Tax=Eubacterium sp. TaxID=142586 RepID=UPI003F018452
MFINAIVVRSMIAEQGVSLSDFAKKVNISKQGLSAILSRGSCSTVNAGKIAKGLEVSVQQIIKEV